MNFKACHQLNLMPLTQRSKHAYLYFFQELRVNETDENLIKLNYKKKFIKTFLYI